MNRRSVGIAPAPSPSPIENPTAGLEGTWTEVSQKQKEKLGCVILFGDNVEVSAPTSRPASDPIALTVKKILDFARSSGLLKVVSALLSIPATTVAFVLQSLSAMFENLPLRSAIKFAEYLEKDVHLAKEIAHCILGAAEAPTELVTAVLRVRASPHFHSFTVIKKDINPSPSQLVVRVYFAHDMGSAKGRATCVAVSKCVRLMRDRVWRVKGRVMVLCVSSEEEIIFSKVIPGMSGQVINLRSRLASKLKSVPRILPLFADDDTLCGKNVTTAANLFFVISFTREVHYFAVDELLACCKNMNVKIQEYVPDTFVNVQTW